MNINLTLLWYNQQISKETVALRSLQYFIIIYLLREPFYKGVTQTFELEKKVFEYQKVWGCRRLRLCCKLIRRNEYFGDLSVTPRLFCSFSCLISGRGVVLLNKSKTLIPTVALNKQAHWLNLNKEHSCEKWILLLLLSLASVLILSLLKIPLLSFHYLYRVRNIC